MDQMERRIDETSRRISELAAEMRVHSESLEKTHTFTAMKVLIDWLAEMNAEANYDDAYTHGKLTSALGNAAALAEIDDSRGFSPQALSDHLHADIMVACDNLKDAYARDGALE